MDLMTENFGNNEAVVVVGKFFVVCVGLGLELIFLYGQFLRVLLAGKRWVIRGILHVFEKIGLTGFILDLFSGLNRIIMDGG